jgi:CheY-like chemotaxis protein
MSSATTSLAVQPTTPLTPPDAPSLLPASPTRHLRVLVAEDEPVARLRLVRMIQRLGHEVMVAADGVIAWELFSRQGADVVVTDWLMPGMDGRELCRRVRADKNSPYTYVIFSTVLEGEENVHEALRAGADDYLIKPTPVEDIEARLIVAEHVTALHRGWAQARAYGDTLLQFVTSTRPKGLPSGRIRTSYRCSRHSLNRWNDDLRPRAPGSSCSCSTPR